MYPGVKLYRHGELNEDVYRVVLANTRLPKRVAGDLNAEVIGLRTGAGALLRLVERYGLERFRESVEHMFDHGEAVIRSYFEKIPDGRYVGRGVLDNNGVDDELVPFDVVLEVKGSTVTADYSGAPDAQAGPINCPQASTVSASRVAVCMIAGGGEAPTEGHFRPLEVVTRPGSMFHPLPPTPCFLYAWPGEHAIEVIYSALAAAMPESVPASSGGDECAVTFWGVHKETGEPWAGGAAHPVGQGGHLHGDGGSALAHVSGAATRFPPVEVWEARNPWLMEKVELAADSAGAGRSRGGLGVEFFFCLLEDAWMTSVVEATRTPPWGLEGGREGVPNRVALRLPGQTATDIPGKGTRIKIPKGATVELHTGGGGGYGPPTERDPQRVHDDLREGYISEEQARRYYPHAFGSPA